MKVWWVGVRLSHCILDQPEAGHGNYHYEDHCGQQLASRVDFDINAWFVAEVIVIEYLYATKLPHAVEYISSSCCKASEEHRTAQLSSGISATRPIKNDTAQHASDISKVSRLTTNPFRIQPSRTRLPKAAILSDTTLRTTQRVPRMNFGLASKKAVAKSLFSR